jgi:hypothetical protein
MFYRTALLSQEWLAAAQCCFGDRAPPTAVANLCVTDHPAFRADCTSGPSMGRIARLCGPGRTGLLLTVLAGPPHPRLRSVSRRDAGCQAGTQDVSVQLHLEQPRRGMRRARNRMRLAFGAARCKGHGAATARHAGRGFGAHLPWTLECLARNLLATAKKSPVDRPHIRIPVSPSTAESSRHSAGRTRSPYPTVV